jgi:hypothetical protein
MLVADRRRRVAHAGTPSIRAAVDVDSERFVDFFLGRVLP